MSDKLTVPELRDELADVVLRSARLFGSDDLGFAGRVDADAVPAPVVLAGRFVTDALIVAYGLLCEDPSERSVMTDADDFLRRIIDAGKRRRLQGTSD